MRLLTIILLSLAMFCAHQLARADATISNLDELEAHVDQGDLSLHPDNGRIVAKALIAEVRELRAKRTPGWGFFDPTRQVCEIQIAWVQELPGTPQMLLPNGKCAEMADVVLSESLTHLLQQIANGNYTRAK